MIMTDQPVVLDLFCCAGGATRGYQRAGFRAYGVDKVKRRNYCGDEFWEHDAIRLLEKMLSTPFGFGWIELIHASPPCQAGSAIKRGTNDSKGWGRQDHEQLVPATRELLERSGIPYVIEQPTGHAGLIRTDLRLCMDTFRGSMPPPWVQRHRDFEFGNWPGSLPLQPKHSKHQGYVRGLRHGVWREGPYVAAYGEGGGKAEAWEMQHAMGIDWTDEREELTEAIPPAYTEYIGRSFLLTSE